MADGKIQMPGSFGGLMRYDDEYESKFKLGPVAVIGFLIFIIVFVIGLNVIWPIVAPVAAATG